MKWNYCFTFLKPLVLILLFAVLVILPQLGCSQDIPKVILPSPEAMTFFRFQNYPVNHSTGVPQINVPLYEIKSGSLNLPIEITYHASGRRIDDQDGPIALGWSLNAGGTISRTIKGSTDFGQYKFPYPFKTEGISNQSDYLYLEQIMHYTLNPVEVNTSNWKDSEYDIFSYSFGDQNGRFVFKDQDDIKIPVLIPYKPFVVTPVYNNNPGTFSKLSGINILDDKGILYQFLSTGHYTDNQGTTAQNEYSLSKIISADKADTISFTYVPFNQTRASISETIQFKDDINGFLGNFDYLTEATLTQSTNYDFYTISRLRQITFRNGKILFNLVTGKDKVDNIQIFDQTNIPIRTIQFSQSQQDASSAGTITNITNKLDRFVFKDAGGNDVEQYSFEYYPTVNAGGTTINSFDPRFRDWWGYYNASENYNLIPRYSGLTRVRTGNVDLNFEVGNSSTNRSPSLNGMQSGVLKKITYPTGGSTEFIYELNRYQISGNSQGEVGPGLRVFQIKTNDRSGTISYKTYKYGEDEKGYGLIDLEPNLNNMAKESHYYYYMPNNDQNPYYNGNTTFRERVLYDSFIPSLKEMSSRPVFYQKVTEYIGTPDDNNGKIVYAYDYLPWLAQSFQFSRDGISIRPQHVVDHNYWNTPSLISQKVYKNMGNYIPYQLVKETDNTYAATITENVPGLHVERMNTFPQTLQAGDPDPAYSGRFVEPWAIMRAGNPANAPYAFAKYVVSTGSKNLASTKETLYNEDGISISNLTTYSYNSRQYPSSIVSEMPDNTNVVVERKYPFDYPNDVALLAMSNQGLNMLNYLIEETKLKNNVLLEATKTNYFNWGTGIIPRFYPQNIQTKRGTSPYEVKIRFHQYDIKGNILSVSKDNGPLESYIWGYNRQYPVAKVDNASYSTIETQLGGGAAVNSFSNSIPTDPSAVYNFLNPLSNIEGIQVTSYTYKPLVGIVDEIDQKGYKKTYVYDNYQRLIAEKDNNGNILRNYIYNFSNGTSDPSGLYFNSYVSRNYDKNNCSAGTGTNVTYRVPARKYSSNISQADADAKALADINSNGQNYANQFGKCYFSNAMQQKIFTRNNCVVGVNGSTITYTIDAGKYISFKSQTDADAMASADLNVKGQQYANERGTCGFYNIKTVGTFTKTGCPVNTIPSEVAYWVEAGRHYSAISQADADAKAETDIANNGQNYANMNGSCTKAVTFSFLNNTTDKFGVSFMSSDGYSKSYTCNMGSSTLLLPEGIYSISVQNITSNTSHQLYVGSRTAVFGTYATFINVNVSSVSTIENNLRMSN